MTKIPFVDRDPTTAEIERIRLILSTYQDGTGMLAVAGGRTLPGWRDFERAVAVALGGTAQESKAVFDVVLQSPSLENRPHYGISCKMRRELNRIKRDGRVTMEISNAAGEFWDSLGTVGVTKSNYGIEAAKAGGGLMRVVSDWHQAEDVSNGGRFDINQSRYLVLLWNNNLEYQLFLFPLTIFDAASLKWSVPISTRQQGREGRRLCGSDGVGTAVEWYGSSGGQLKLYPLASTALWQSPKFQLEPLPESIRPVKTKAENYFPDLWKAANP